MTEADIAELLSTIDDLVNDKARLASLRTVEISRLEEIRGFLKTLQALGPELSEEQKSRLLIRLLETLKRYC